MASGSGRRLKARRDKPQLAHHIPSEFDKPKSHRPTMFKILGKPKVRPKQARPKMFKPLEEVVVKRPKLDAYHEQDVIVPEDMTARQKKRLIKVLK